MRCFDFQSWEKAHDAPHHKFIFYALMIMKLAIVIEIDACYAKVTKIFLASQLLHNYDVITLIYGAHMPKLYIHKASHK